MLGGADGIFLLLCTRTTTGMQRCTRMACSLFMACQTASTATTTQRTLQPHGPGSTSVPPIRCALRQQRGWHNQAQQAAAAVGSYMGLLLAAPMPSVGFLQGRGPLVAAPLQQQRQHQRYLQLALPPLTRLLLPPLLHSGAGASQKGRCLSGAPHLTLSRTAGRQHLWQQQRQQHQGQQQRYWLALAALQAAVLRVSPPQQQQQSPTTPCGRWQRPFALGRGCQCFGAAHLLRC